MPRRKREVIFEAEVEYEQGHLSEREGTHIAEVVVKTLTVDLPKDLSQLFGVEVDIHIKGMRYGSLSVFFGAVLTAYGILAGYKDVYESVELIRQQAHELLHGALRPLGGFLVHVNTRYPKLENPESMWFRRLRRYVPDPFVAEFLAGVMPPHEAYPPRRDGFFWFLLTLCIAAFVAIGFLVYGAVIKTYF